MSFGGIVFCLLFALTSNLNAQCTATVEQDDICGNNGIISVSTTLSGPFTYQWFDSNGNSFPTVNSSLNSDTSIRSLYKNDFISIEVP